MKILWIYKIARRQLYNGNRANTSIIMFCVELENLFLELGRAMYRLSFANRKFSKHKYLKLFSSKLVYLFCQNVLAKGGSVVKYIDWLEIRQIKVQMSVHYFTFLLWIKWLLWASSCWFLKWGYFRVYCQN